MGLNKTISELLKLANKYPSPHNGQPLRFRQIDDNSFDLYFERERGLQATGVSFIFSFVSMGVFVEHLSLSARALGHDFSFDPSLPNVSDLKGSGPVRLGVCGFSWNERQPDRTLRLALEFRQTSRKKYSAGLDEVTRQDLDKLAETNSMKLGQLTPEQGRQAIWLNQRAVFDDMLDEPVRQELDHWLRYNKQEKEAKKDGLAYDCMQLNGKLMRHIVNHPKILRAPVASALLKQYYLRTMADKSDVFYMLAPFRSGPQSFKVGEVIMSMWQLIAANGYYLHPFGTIMSNQAAHRDFVRLANVSDESRDTNYLVFIFRAGVSEKPASSLRLPVEDHLLMGAERV